MVCFTSLVLKSMTLSYAPDLEHILEIAVCVVKINSHCMKSFMCIGKDCIRDLHASWP